MRKYVLSGLASLLMTALTFGLMALSVNPPATQSGTQSTQPTGPIVQQVGAQLATAETVG